MRKRIILMAGIAILGCAVLNAEAMGKKAGRVESSGLRVQSQTTGSGMDGSAVEGQTTGKSEDGEKTNPGQGSASAPDADDLLSNQSVITEVYVRRVLIEGKWGTNEGEFGGGTACYPGEIDRWFDSKFKWAKYGLTVSGDGNVYILDGGNNRIQKFTADGKFLKIIRVDSFVGFHDYSRPIIVMDGDDEDDWIHCYTATEAYGGQLSIDSENRLYFYTIRKAFQTNRIKPDKNNRPIYEVTPNPSAKGELWIFENDKLVKKMGVPVANSMHVDFEDTVWVGSNRVIENEVVKKIKKERERGIKESKVEGRESRVTSRGTIIEYRHNMRGTNEIAFVLNEREKKRIRLSAKLTGNQRFVVGKPELGKGGNEIYIHSTIYDPLDPLNPKQSITRIYNTKGVLIGVLLGTAPNRDGNSWKLESSSQGVKVFKNERVKK